MSRPKLRSPDQPLPVQAILCLFEFFASLKLAVLLIFASALALAWATFVESEYGTPAVQFGVYGSTWFGVLNLLLAINIFCAAAIRYPWKRYQTGFVITHIGLLTLLFGCLLSRRGAIDAQMPIFEDGTNQHAYTDNHDFRLEVIRPNSSERAVLEIPFQPGPFNWQDYGTLFQPVAEPKIDRKLLERLTDPILMTIKNALRWSTGLTFKLTKPEQGVLYDQDGVRLEVLDYYSDSVQTDVPLVELKMSTPAPTVTDSHGRQVPGEVSWVPIRLQLADQFPIDFPNGLDFGRDVGGGRITFRLAGSRDEREAFLSSRPQGKLGPKGQLVLYAGSKSHYLDVAELVDDKQGTGRTKLGDSGFEIELSKFFENGGLRPPARDDQQPLELVASRGEQWPKGPAVELTVFKGDQPQGRLVLFSDHPEASIQADSASVFGSYWFDHGEKKAEELLRGAGTSRIDLLQGEDEQLYYRYWNRREVVALAPLPTDGTRVPAFKMPIAQLEMYVEQFIPSKKVSKIELPLAFNSKKAPAEKRPAAKLRLVVDGKPREFWLAGMVAGPLNREPLASSGEVQSAPGDGRVLIVTMPPHDALEEAGFQVRLKKFHRKLDPGTSQASHFGSTFDILSRPEEEEDKRPQTLLADAEIEMNVPIDFCDPKTGQTYRLFQESFSGPWGPRDPIYRQHADISAGRDHFYMSVLTVNYDPGRGLKYTGCALIVAGTFTMFYMRAYFFKKPDSRKAIASEQRTVAEQFS